MGVKGDWPRKVDSEKFDKNFNEAFGRKCRLHHQHDETCKEDNNTETTDKGTE